MTNNDQTSASTQEAATEEAPVSDVSTRRLHRTVTCAWCGNRYRSAVPSDLDRGLQGSHCASDVVQEDGKWLVRGGYGSDEHDMHRYVFVANPPSAPADPVCDECISQRLHAGDLEDVGLEADRRPSDFSPRPRGTWELVYQIRRLLEDMIPMRALIAATLSAVDAVPPELAEAVSAYRKYQRWNGEIQDDGEQYAEGCPEVVAQMREAARLLEEIAAFWERWSPQRASRESTKEPPP